MQGPPQRFASSGLPVRPTFSQPGYGTPQAGSRSGYVPEGQLGGPSRMTMSSMAQRHVASRTTSGTAMRCVSTSPPTANASTSTGSSWSGSKGPSSGKNKEASTMPRAGASSGMPPPSQGVQSASDRKRSAQSDSRASGTTSESPMKPKKKKKIADKILTKRVRDLVPESQAYMDLLAFEQKLDATIMRKRLDIQEALKRPVKQKRKLRIFISNTFFPPKEGEDDDSVPSWELRIEGRLLEDAASSKTTDTSKVKRKFSSFFKSLVIELDKDLYGPDNHLVEWHRTPTTQETDGFQVKRPGDQNVRCTVLLMLDYQPVQFKLDQRLARLLGIHTQTRPVIINALWQYIKTHKLQDPYEREYINCDKYMEQIFECKRMKFSDIPSKLLPLLMPPDPIVINHIITWRDKGVPWNKSLTSAISENLLSVSTWLPGHTVQKKRLDGPDAKKTCCYDIDVEVDDTLKQQMNSFLLSAHSQQEIANLESKINETVETINQQKTNREFFLSFARDPKAFLNNWLISQTRDLKTMTDVVGNPEEERRADFFYQPWAQEAVCRYFYGKVNQRRLELEQALGLRNT
ncbi:SWI/SNF-related matrix-associated actin-dependent regulator of chromatin subfamily D member 1-like isoform X2 [Babylonia areolata]|uniref:SWI/SNF-related matrix-associated actin-dependent regulator of chromatin subfamily D member 1-like isoform X2 n=1 Tax=Babylonia areolata TaxID=304850 RepID=UPI003FD4EAF9